MIEFTKINYFQAIGPVIEMVQLELTDFHSSIQMVLVLIRVILSLVTGLIQIQGI